MWRHLDHQESVRPRGKSAVAVVLRCAEHKHASCGTSQHLPAKEIMFAAGCFAITSTEAASSQCFEPQVTACKQKHIFGMCAQHADVLLQGHAQDSKHTAGTAGPGRDGICSVYVRRSAPAASSNPVIATAASSPLQPATATATYSTPSQPAATVVTRRSAASRLAGCISSRSRRSSSKSRGHALVLGLQTSETQLCIMSFGHAGAASFAAADVVCMLATQVHIRLLWRGVVHIHHSSHRADWGCTQQPRLPRSVRLFGHRPATGTGEPHLMPSSSIVFVVAHAALPIESITLIPPGMPSCCRSLGCARQ